MTISSTLNEFLNQQKVPFELIPHPHTSSSMDTVRQAQVPGNRLAKAVVVKQDDKYSMVIVPSVEQVDLAMLRDELGRKLELATESELGEIFPDCEIGAVPPIGPAWGLNTYLDDSFLTDSEEVFFEAGDHEDLVRVSGDQFQKLQGNARHGHYGHTL
ncbi:MAG: YbaK/EbsC family protein [Gammaproteobacteria bacterium]|nr:YbaK/EbsC family protein [Gammaproteobacteria bacterium]